MFETSMVRPLDVKTVLTKDMQIFYIATVQFAKLFYSFMLVLSCVAMKGVQNDLKSYSVSQRGQI